MKACSNGPGDMIKMAAMPLYTKKRQKKKKKKNIKNIFVWNRKSDDLETWYTALSTLDYQVYIFYGKVKFGPLCFCMGKS